MTKDVCVQENKSGEATNYGTVVDKKQFDIKRCKCGKCFKTWRYNQK